MATNGYFNNFPSQQRAWNEFGLMEDVIVESIKIMGHNVYYIPRESFDEGDMVYGEYAKSNFNNAFLIEAYLANVQQHGGQQDFFSKFGLEIRDQDSFILSRRSFLNIIPSTIRTRPQEGDLVYVPVLHKMYEIKFIEQELMFHSLGKRLPFVYEMKCEAFRASQEPITTGVAEVDQVGIDNSYTIELNVIPAIGHLALNFIMGETVYQSPDGTWANNVSNATIKQWFSTNGTLQLYNVVGTFSNNTLLWGNTSGVAWNVDRKSTRLNSSHIPLSRMPSSA